MEKRIINVVCVSKKISGLDYRGSLQHLNIAGPALLNEEKETIEFLGEVYEIISTRTGLDSTALVYEVRELTTSSQYDVWDLYTDIPCVETSTSESIKEHARYCVEWKDALGVRRPM
jgi:hypothetical protein